ncbi:MAG TPA: mechanosensitive ion channel domain-containing protein [Gammaproteobacteria bacterium]|jgi:miniconductance mechanosensitive channel
MDSWINNLQQLGALLPSWATATLGVSAVMLLALVAELIAKRRLVGALNHLTRQSRYRWDDALIDAGVYGRLAQLLPTAIVFFGLRWVPELSDTLVRFGENLALSYGALMTSLSISALLTAANTVYEQYPVAKERPLKGYIQVAKIVLFVLTGVLIIAILMDRSPVLMLSGFGAMTAVLLLVFKDTILSLVASIQLSGLDMLRVGDWIEMPSCGADGDVIDIALHTVKVQNWDKTITSIPTHKLISDSFKNWRGMSQSGGRRIKRSVYIDQSSIRFLSDAEVEKFKRFALLCDYMRAKEKELAEYNAGVGRTENAAIRRLTNVGTFRAYLLNYLKHHPRIRTDMTLLARQLEPGPRGLPLEAYAFTNTTEWRAYEDIQADIFDHLLAVADEFGLNVYQEPSGRDVAALAPLRPTNSPPSGT